MSPGHDEYKGVEKVTFSKMSRHTHTQHSGCGGPNTIDRTRQHKTKYRCTTQPMYWSKPVLTHRCIGRYSVQVAGKGNLMYFFYTATVADTVRILWCSLAWPDTKWETRRDHPDIEYIQAKSKSHRTQSQQKIVALRYLYLRSTYTSALAKYSSPKILRTSASWYPPITTDTK